MDPRAVTWEGAMPAITWQGDIAGNINPNHKYILLPFSHQFLRPRKQLSVLSLQILQKKLLRKLKVKIEKIKSQYPLMVPQPKKNL